MLESPQHVHCKKKKLINEKNVLFGFYPSPYRQQAITDRVQTARPLLFTENCLRTATLVNKTRLGLKDNFTPSFLVAFVHTKLGNPIDTHMPQGFNLEKCLKRVTKKATYVLYE
jgi:hypothetical protein